MKNFRRKIISGYDGTPNSMTLHLLLLLHRNSLSLSSGTKARGDGEDIEDSNSTGNPSESKSVVAAERRTSHALKPIPLSHNFYNVIMTPSALGAPRTSNAHTVR